MINKNNMLYYEIEIKNNLGADWEIWFNDMQISPLRNGHTLIKGNVKDQPALRGIMEKLWNLNCKIIKVELKLG
ncbi:MAG: hypothetical protein CL609_20160 [Anaerolineaceae bacterium]|nr:hypothetical protein [Anaerolineaceae bacterium]